MKTMHQTGAAVGVAAMAVAFLSGTARAAITGVTGQTTWLGSPPVACGFGQLAGFTSFAWDEQQGVTLATLAVDMVNNPGASGGAIPGSLAGTFDSHFLHYENVPGVVAAAGSVTFSGQIVGVIFSATLLDGTDALLGAPGTAYPTLYPLRGLNNTSSFTISGNTLNYQFVAFGTAPDVVQVRVITRAVPAPGAAGLALSAGLLAARRRRK